MQNEGLREEGADLRPFYGPLPWPLLAIAAGIAAAAFYAYIEVYRSLTLPEHVEPPALAAPAPAPEPAAPLVTMPAAQAASSLPSLDNSDALIREKLVALIGQVPFSEMVLPIALVRRIVATVDNLPRETAPRRVIPLAPVPGAYAPENLASTFERYAPYVRVFEAIDEKALVQDYARAYPLFQQAYRELGYPNLEFNDRLMQAIDDLLSTPELDGPVELIRPRVHYEFASPELETRSAGQKLLLRMGAENAARVKAKLVQVRRELIAASKPR